VIHATTAGLDYEVEQLRAQDDADEVDQLAEVVDALSDAATADSLPCTLDWLTGRHEGWGDLWGTLPDRLRDRMERAAGDLALGLPLAGLDASTALRDAVALLKEYRA
jgi:hypothetical protein